VNLGVLHPPPPASAVRSLQPAPDRLCRPQPALSPQLFGCRL